MHRICLNADIVHNEMRGICLALIMYFMYLQILQHLINKLLHVVVAYCTIIRHPERRGGIPLVHHILSMYGNLIRTLLKEKSNNILVVAHPGGDLIIILDI